jgi:hypothetical protein
MPGRGGCQGRWSVCGLPLRGSWWFQKLWLNCYLMFARRIRVEYEENGRRVPCPLKWLDSFSMRNFTNASVFDNTLPVADGLMEIGTHVPVKELKAAMEDWFRRKSYLPKAGVLVLTQAKDTSA